MQKPVKMEAFFDYRAKTYEDHMFQKPEEGYWRELFEKHLPKTNNELSIIDLGCGTGLEIKSILKRIPNAYITCIDLSESMLNELKRTYSNHLNQLNIIKASYFEYEFEKSDYDIAVACVTMHHWLFDEKVKLYKRIYNSLKFGGSFIDNDYIVPEEKEKAFLSEYMDLLKSGKIKKNQYYHIDIPFSMKTEIKALGEAGFSDIKIIEEYYSDTFNSAMIISKKNAS